MSFITEIAPANDGIKRPLIWQCVDKDDGHRRGKDYSKCRPACGKWNVKMTSRRDGNRDSRWQAKCKHCSKRTSLNAGEVEWYETRQDAVNEMRRRNE